VIRAHASSKAAVVIKIIRGALMLFVAPGLWDSRSAGYVGRKDSVRYVRSQSTVSERGSVRVQPG